MDGHICSAGSDGKLNIWRIPENFLEDDSHTAIKTQNKKKRKTNKKILPFISSSLPTLHTDAINSLAWILTNTICTGSSDHSIKLIDVQKMTEQRSLLTRDSITTAIDYSNSTLFTSHQDGYIRTWDLRASHNNINSGNSSPSASFKSHSRYASDVKVHPHSNIFISVLNTLISVLIRPNY